MSGGSVRARQPDQAAATGRAAESAAEGCDHAAQRLGQGFRRAGPRPGCSGFGSELGLLRISRVLEGGVGSGPAVRPDRWWPATGTTTRRRPGRSAGRRPPSADTAGPGRGAGCRSPVRPGPRPARTAAGCAGHPGPRRAERPGAPLARPVSGIPGEPGDDRRREQMLGLDAGPRVLEAGAQPGQHRNQQLLPGADAAVPRQRGADGFADPLLVQGQHGPGQSAGRGRGTGQRQALTAGAMPRPGPGRRETLPGQAADRPANPRPLA